MSIDQIVVSQQQQIINQLINIWKNQSQAVSTFLDKHEDEAYMNQLAEGRNRAVYVFGHIVSASDDMLPLLGFGERLHPELQELFSTNPDKSFNEIPSVAELKSYWKTINEKLAGEFSTLTPESWLDRHTRVNEEDFAKDPTRNKLTVLITRTNHISYHLGQLNLLNIKK
jgi:hypothetical protein